MLLIGSRALKEWHPELLDHDPVDYDLIATHEEFRQFVLCNKFETIYPVDNGNKIICRASNLPPVEVEIAWEGTSAEMLMKILQPYCMPHVDCEELNSSFMVARPCDLFALKASHRYKKNSPFFLKTRRDYMALKRVTGGEISSDLVEFYKLREKETYSYGHPKLNVKKNQFFTGDGVEYVYDHDTIHQAVAYPNPPAYKSYQPSENEVNTSKALFDAQTHETKLLGVLEESYVLALERSQVPYRGLLTPRKSFLMALEKVCTSITSGWFRAWAYDHYDEVVALYNDNYIHKLADGVKSGLVTIQIPAKSDEFVAYTESLKVMSCP